VLFFDMVIDNPIIITKRSQPLRLWIFKGQWPRPRRKLSSHL